MKLAVIKIITKGNEKIGYWKDEEHIVTEKEHAFYGDINYMNGLCRGINFAINFYGDEFIDHAEVEIVK